MDLFCYGTLLFPEVMRAVIGRTPPGYDARLSNYACRYLRGADYPAIISQPDSGTTGRVYTGLRMAESRQLDAYEGWLYQRTQLVVTDNRNRPHRVWCYTLHASQQFRLSTRPWCINDFQPRLARYLASL